MARINCGVSSCSYNKESICYADTVNIGGIGATNKESTCCGSFLNQQHYSNLAEYTSNRGSAEVITCQVDTCAFNADQECRLTDIEVGGIREATIYTETRCQSFSRS
jgi:hypothetical protein